ncbi:glutamate cyclase domain-containing protein [Falsiroseomonas sp. HW251]|uniref:glutamate cyclase domain-containing protein n=1 Tax=Falsiroseomonas sp. HW251 TaxID=3390998 RepID=UPI003D31AE7C
MEIAADNMDRLLAVEMRRRGRGRGFKWVLYETARAQSDQPLVLAAAAALDRPPGKVAIVTGAAVPQHMPAGENDGPFGAVALARALGAIGHDATIWSDIECIPPIEGLLRFMKLGTAAATLRMGDTAQQEEIARGADIVIAIERLGGNINGHLHGISGVPRDAFQVNVDHLFRTATALGRTTIGIGDGGNEVGFGRIREALIARMPEHNQEAATPCGGGIYSALPTDILVIGSTSNLGSYGVMAALAMRRGDLSLCRDPEVEVALHHVGVGLGLTDGGGGGVIAECDGIPAVANAAVVTLLNNIAARELDPPRARGF